MTITSPPLGVMHLPSPAAPAVRTSKLERDSHLNQLTLVLDELKHRYPEIPRTTIRSLAVDVLCHSQPERLTPSMVARVLEARLLAYL